MVAHKVRVWRGLHRKADEACQALSLLHFCVSVSPCACVALSYLNTSCIAAEQQLGRETEQSREGEEGEMRKKRFVLRTRLFCCLLAAFTRALSVCVCVCLSHVYLYLFICFLSLSLFPPPFLYLCISRYVRLCHCVDPGSIPCSLPFASCRESLLFMSLTLPFWYSLLVASSVSLSLLCACSLCLSAGNKDLRIMCDL